MAEGKDLSDLVHSNTADQIGVYQSAEAEDSYPHRLLVITAALSHVKSRYAHTASNPNEISQSLIACWPGFNTPQRVSESENSTRAQSSTLR